jgi:hypothetical protein
MDIEKKLDEVGARFEQCPLRSLKTPYTGDHDFRNISSNCRKTAEIEPYRTAVVQESPGMYVKQ